MNRGTQPQKKMSWIKVLKDDFFRPSSDLAYSCFNILDELQMSRKNILFKNI